MSTPAFLAFENYLLVFEKVTFQAAMSQFGLGGSVCATRWAARAAEKTSFRRCVLGEIVVVGENSEAVDTRNAHAHAYYCRTHTHTNVETQDSGA